MTSTSQPENDPIQIRIVRLEETAKDIPGEKEKFKTTTKILIHVFLWTKERELELNLVHLKNKDNLVDIQLEFVNKAIKPFRNPIPITFLLEVEVDPTNEEKLDFNNKERNVLFVTLENVPDEIRPTGRRRKVVIYEDTDILDDSEGNELS